MDCVQNKKDVFEDFTLGDFAAPRSLLFTVGPLPNLWRLLPPCGGGLLLGDGPKIFGWPRDCQDHLSTLGAVGCLGSLDGIDCLGCFCSIPLPPPFSAGVSLGGSRTSPGIAFGVPAANWPPVSSWVVETAWPLDVLLELVVNLAKLSSKPVEVDPVDNFCPVISAYDFGCSMMVFAESASGGEPEEA